MNKTISVLSALFLTTSALGAVSTKLTETAFQQYKGGEYESALQTLIELEKKPGQKGTVNYWRGLIYNRKKDFSKAISSFEASERRGHKAKDMYYEWAQAHYAENNFDEAIRLFERSCSQGFKCEVSKYYQGHSNELLGMEKKAKGIYEELMRNSGADTEIRQTAAGRLGELALENVLKKGGDNRSKMLEKFVFEPYQYAINLDSSSTVGKNLARRLNEIKGKYASSGKAMASGLPQPAKWQVTFIQGTDYNSNVTFESSGSPNPAVDEDSLIIDSELDASYRHKINNNLITGITGSVQNFEHTKNESVIYAQDRILYGGTWSTGYHFTNQSSKSLNFSLEYERKERDIDADKSKEYESDFFDYQLTYMVSFNDKSITSFELAYKDEDNTSSTSAAEYNQFNIVHIHPFDAERILVGSFYFTDKNVEDETDDEMTYLLRADYMDLSLAKDWMFKPYFGVTMTDTENQDATRGTEFSYNPGIEVKRKINEYIKVAGEYSYTKKTSDDKANFDYDQHVATLALEIDYSIF